VTFTAIGLQVGTGGAATADYYIARGVKGYRLASYEPSLTPEGASGSVATPSENLTRIRTILKPTVTDLANLLGVSRQSIYDWQNGQPISAEHAEKLIELARAADVFAAEGLATNSQILRRSIKSGKNFFDLVRDGESAEGAARSLIQLTRKELAQRKALDARLAHRKRPEVSVQEFGLPMLDERG
jgi:transcriptional regulator with XRE-family HTH domain